MRRVVLGEAVATDFGRLLKLHNLGLTPGNFAIVLELFAILGREPAQVAAGEVLSLLVLAHDGRLSCDLVWYGSGCLSEW